MMQNFAAKHVLIKSITVSEAAMIPFVMPRNQHRVNGGTQIHHEPANTQHASSNDDRTALRDQVRLMAGQLK
jgi:hypothetical protein